MGVCLCPCPCIDKIKLSHDEVIFNDRKDNNEAINKEIIKTEQLDIKNE